MTLKALSHVFFKFSKDKKTKVETKTHENIIRYCHEN